MYTPWGPTLPEKQLQDPDPEERGGDPSQRAPGSAHRHSVTSRREEASCGTPASRLLATTQPNPGARDPATRIPTSLPTTDWIHGSGLMNGSDFQWIRPATVGPEPSGVPADTGAERNKGLLNFGRENILLQAQESPPGGGKMSWGFPRSPCSKREIHSAEEHELHIPEEETMFHPVEEQDESVPIRPSRRRCNQGTSATELERPRSFTGLLENPRATRKQHREGH
ncbi:unnamed protein product, partial [Pleuronectes platessa]